jgi:hypothetical protein
MLSSDTEMSEELIEPMRGLVSALDPNLPIVETRTYDDLYRYNAVEGPRIAMELPAGAASILDCANTGAALRIGPFAHAAVRATGRPRMRYGVAHHGAAAHVTATPAPPGDPSGAKVI